MHATRLPAAALLLALFIAAGCAVTTAPGHDAYRRGEFDRALAAWQPLADRGDAEGQFLVGLLHDLGQGTPQDPVAAALWYRLAAEQGHAAAQNNLGMLYFDGRGVGLSYEEAERWYARAAEQGFAPAQNNLGIVRLLSARDPAEEAVAHRLLFAAAEGGDVQAQLTLAQLYEKGLGLEQDAVRAEHWYRRAAEQGSPKGRFKLGLAGRPEAEDAPRGVLPKGHTVPAAPPPGAAR